MIYNYFKWISYQTGSKRNEFGYDNHVKFDDFDQTNPGGDDQMFYKEKVYQTKRAPLPSNYPSGSKIIHALYGEGTVLDSEGLGQDEKVTIMFRDGIRKKFMVKFAPLQKV